MGEKRLSSEQIIVMLREAEVLESKRLVQIRKALKVHGPNLGKLTNMSTSFKFMTKKLNLTQLFILRQAIE